MNRDDPPPSQRASGPASSRAPGSSRAPSSSPPPSSHPPASQRRVPSQRRPEPVVEILSPLPPGDPAAPDAPPPPGPDPGEQAPKRPTGLLLGVGAMLLVPAVVAGLVLAYIPRLRPWGGEGLATAASVQPAEGPVPEGKVQVSGRVVDAEGDPVEGAKISVFIKSREAPSGEHTSAKGGVYSLELDAGRYVLVAEHDDKGVAASAELMLSRGAQIKNMVLTLGPVRVVRGSVVAAEDGAKIAGAQVKIEGVPWLRRTATSEADGAYRVARVPMVEATLRVAAPGYAPATVKLQISAPAGEEVIDVKLAKEQNLEGRVIDPENRPLRAGVLACDGKEPGQRVVSNPDGKFKIAREFARCPLVAFHDTYGPSEPALAEGSGIITLRLRPGGAISGVVVDDDGSPVRPYHLGIESFTPSFADRLSLRLPEARPYDEAGGAFTVDKLAPGSYVLSAWADGRSMVRSPSIEVRAGQTTQGIRVILPRGGAVEGLITDEERKPVGGARVTFDTASSLRREGASTASDDLGKFRLEGAPSGPFSLRVEHDGHRTRILSGLRVNNGETLKQEISLKAAGDGGAGLDFVGIGAAIESSREGLVFRRIYESSPAEQAGLKPGDLLRRIDGSTIEGLSLADAIQRLRGDKGSQVRVAIERPSTTEFLELTITRGEIVR